MLQITKEQKEKANEIGRKHNVEKVFVNDKGEFFTVENYAKLSVNGDKDKIAVVVVSASTSDDNKSNTTGSATAQKATTETATAAELITAIEATTEITAVQAILDAEKQGRKRATVLAAAGKKIESFKSVE